MAGLARTRVSRTMLQSLAHEPMVPTGMRHIDQQQSIGHVCAVCGGFAATERGTNHLWTGPATTDHFAEACSVATPQPTPAADPATPAVHVSVRATPIMVESLAGLRQNLNGLGVTDNGAFRALRDMFDPMRRVGSNA